MPTTEILPLFPISRKGAVLGDSRVAGGWQSTSNGGATSLLENPFAWAAFLSGGRVSFPSALNFGVSGDTTALVLARTEAAVAAATAAGASFMVVYCGYNDRKPGTPVDYATTIANYAAIADLIVGAGLMLIWVADTPVGDTTYTSARLSGTQLAYHMAVHTWLMDRRHEPFEFVADPWPYMADQTSANGDAIAGMTYDGVHLSGLGAADAVGRALSEQIAVMFPPVSPVQVSNADVYSTDNPRGCALVNPGLSGTSGSIGTGGSGSLPTSWVAPATPSGISAVFSIITTGGRKQMQAVYSGDAAENSFHQPWRQDVSVGAGGVAVGKTYELWWPAEWDASPANIAHISVAIDATSGGASRETLGNTQPSINAFPVTAKSGVFRTEPFTLPVNTTAVRCRMNVQFKGAATSSLTLRAGAPALRATS